MSTNLIFRQTLFGNFYRSYNNFQQGLFLINPLRRYASQRSDNEWLQHLRFVQFCRKNSKQPKIGIISENNTALAELSFNTEIPQDMIEFIDQGIPVDELEYKTEAICWEPLNNEIKLLPAVLQPDKIICIEINYLNSCEKQNVEQPKEPIFFNKLASALIGSGSNVIAHPVTKKLDWGIELAVIIGKEAKQVSKLSAMDYVFGYSIAQDITARDCLAGQYLIGKSMDTFCPLGPCIAHKSIIKDPQNLCVTCKVNGEVMQKGNTNQMIYCINDIISCLSEGITLMPGDVILTGTPPGVGIHQIPSQYLKPGDVIESEIENVGTLINMVVAP